MTGGFTNLSAVKTHGNQDVSGPAITMLPVGVAAGTQEGMQERLEARACSILARSITCGTN